MSCYNSACGKKCTHKELEYVEFRMMEEIGKGCRGNMGQTLPAILKIKAVPPVGDPGNGMTRSALWKGCNHCGMVNKPEVVMPGKT